MDDAADSRISRRTVQGEDDETLLWAVIEPIWPDASTEDELAHLAKATTGQRAIYAAILFAREVDNGGLAQFFGNSSGMYTETVAEGLRVLGADDLLQALSAAMSVFPNREVPIDREARLQIVNQLTPGQLKLLDDIDQRLYHGSGVEQRLSPFCVRYIEAHPEEFFKD